MQVCDGRVGLGLGVGVRVSDGVVVVVVGAGGGRGLELCVSMFCTISVQDYVRVSYSIWYVFRTGFLRDPA